MYWIKVDLTDVPEPEKGRKFTTYVWKLAESSEGPEYEQARYHGQALGVMSEPPGFIAQLDWAPCRQCREEDLTIKGLCRNCRGPLL